MSNPCSSAATPISKSVRPFSVLLTILFLLGISGMTAELIRYRGAARDLGTLEYIFESDRAGHHDDCNQGSNS
jgi:hypothetical protein